MQRAAAIASIEGLARLLRLFRLGAPSLWLDELGTWWILDSGTVGELSDRLFAVVPNGGAYYWLLYGVTRVGGRSEWVLRTPSAICGLLSILCLAIVARRLAPDRPHAPYLAALLLSSTYLHTVLSQDALPYTLVYLFGVLATYFWVRVLQENFSKVGRGVGSRSPASRSSASSGSPPCSSRRCGRRWSGSRSRGGGCGRWRSRSGSRSRCSSRPHLVRLVVLTGSIAGLQGRSLLLYGTFKDYRRGHRWRDAIAALEADLRPTDLLLLRSGFIEEDHAASGGDDAGPSRDFAQGILAGAYNRQS